jgi:hypothetical protein
LAVQAPAGKARQFNSLGFVLDKLRSIFSAGGTGKAWGTWQSGRAAVHSRQLASGLRQQERTAQNDPTFAREAFDLIQVHIRLIGYLS